jgi:putative transposase
VVAALDSLTASRGLLLAIAVDNGTEFTSQTHEVWAGQRGIQLDFSRPGKPKDNALIGSLNNLLCDECLEEQ